MNILRVIFFTIVLSIASFALASQAYASNTNCTKKYNSNGYFVSETCAKIAIDKKVLKPGTKDYVDGLSSLDQKYHEGETVVFQIIVQNIGNEDLTDLQVTDTLPQSVSFLSGPGSYDNNTKKLTFVINSLVSGESQTFYVSAKINNDLVFNNNGIMCPVNYVYVEKKDRLSADDSAQFCVERPLKVYQPVPMKKTPETGPEMLAIPMLFGMGGAGMFLRKKAGK